MTNTRRAPRDRGVRERLLREFDRNFLVEAGAGSGKTHSLAGRMAAGVAAGVYRVEEMAAVTFTRKAAAELRGRFQLALEQRLREMTHPGAAARQTLDAPAASGDATCGPEALGRVRVALDNLDRLFTGTIHAFCAHLIRERPVEARVAPGFVELDEVANARLQAEAWRDFVAQARAAGSKEMLDLQTAGIRPVDLDSAFAAICEHADVHFPPGDAAFEVDPSAARAEDGE